MFACEQAGVSPDFLCLSKGLTGGTMPLAATLTTAEVYNSFLGGPDSGKTFYHGHTYTANPVGCAAALASLDLFEEEGLVDRVALLAPASRKGCGNSRICRGWGTFAGSGWCGARAGF